MLCHHLDQPSRQTLALNFMCCPSLQYTWLWSDMWKRVWKQCVPLTPIRSPVLKRLPSAQTASNCACATDYTNMLSVRPLQQHLRGGGCMICTGISLLWCLIWWVVLFSLFEGVKQGDDLRGGCINMTPAVRKHNFFFITKKKYYCFSAAKSAPPFMTPKANSSPKCRNADQRKREKKKKSTAPSPYPPKHHPYAEFRFS